MELQRGSGPFCALTCPPSSSNCWALCAWWWTAKVMIKKTALMWIVRSQIKETSLHKHIKWTCMQSCFRYGSSFPPLNKKKKGYCDFLSHNSDFFLRIAWYELAIASFEGGGGGDWYVLRIASLYLTIQLYLTRNSEKKSQNCEFISRNSDFISQNCKFIYQNYDLFNSQLRVCITQLWEKKSELWDKKSQKPLFIFYTVAEKGLHTLEKCDS